MRTAFGIRKSGPLKGTLKKGYRFNSNGRVVKAKKFGVKTSTKKSNPWERLSSLEKRFTIRKKDHDQKRKQQKRAKRNRREASQTLDENIAELAFN